MTASPPYPQVDQEIFSGPIDLLVYEIRRQIVPIEEISMVPLAARFFAYVHTAPGRNLTLDIDGLHWAATLIQWQSRSLLPRPPEEQVSPRDPVRDELAEFLRRHRHDAAKRLAEQQRLEEAWLSPAPRETLGLPTRVPRGRRHSVLERLRPHRPCPDLARWIPGYRASYRHCEENLRVQAETVTVSQMSQVLRGALTSYPSLSLDALPLLLSQPTPAHGACFFLRLLEMVRDQEITVRQARLTWALGVRTKDGHRNLDRSEAEL